MSNTQTDKKNDVKAPEIAFTYTPTQLAKWKQDNAEIHAIDVVGDDDELIRGIFKKPDLAIIMAADAMSADGEMLKRAEFAFTNCWIAGDPRLQIQEDLKISAGIKVYTLFKIRPTTITKL